MTWHILTLRHVFKTESLQIQWTLKRRPKAQEGRGTYLFALHHRLLTLDLLNALKRILSVSPCARFPFPLLDGRFSTKLLNFTNEQHQECGGRKAY
jgi:hypothetical protein